jgi:hypothetical protein
MGLSAPCHHTTCVGDCSRLHVASLLTGRARLQRSLTAPQVRSTHRLAAQATSQAGRHARRHPPRVCPFPPSLLRSAAFASRVAPPPGWNPEPGSRDRPPHATPASLPHVAAIRTRGPPMPCHPPHPHATAHRPRVARADLRGRAVARPVGSSEDRHPQHIPSTSSSPVSSSQHHHRDTGPPPPVVARSSLARRAGC